MRWERLRKKTQNCELFFDGKMVTDLELFFADISISEFVYGYYSWIRILNRINYSENHGRRKTGCGGLTKPGGGLNPTY